MFFENLNIKKAIQYSRLIFKNAYISDTEYDTNKKTSNSNFLSRNELYYCKIIRLGYVCNISNEILPFCIFKVYSVVNIHKGVFKVVHDKGLKALNNNDFLNNHNLCIFQGNIAVKVFKTESF